MNTAIDAFKRFIDVKNIEIEKAELKVMINNALRLICIITSQKYL